MKDVKLIFDERSTSKHEVCDIADRLVHDVQRVFDHMAALIDYPNQRRLERYIKENVSLVIDDIHTPYKNGVSAEKSAERANAILRKYGDRMPQHIHRTLEEIGRVIEDDNNHHPIRENACMELEGLLREYRELPKGLYEDLIDLIKNYNPVSYKITGQYVHGNSGRPHRLYQRNNNEKYIIIYLKNCRENRLGFFRDDYEYILSVFAHELFHAFHFNLFDSLYRGEKIIDCYNTETEIIVESLASYFEVSFDRYCGYNQRADNIERAWNRYSYYAYPYSGARLIYDDVHFRQVFVLSLMDFFSAFHILVSTHPYVLKQIGNKEIVTYLFIKAYSHGEIDQTRLNALINDAGIFGLHYSFLIEDDNVTKRLERRYYTDLININGINYRICNDWYSGNIDDLMREGFENI